MKYLAMEYRESLIVLRNYINSELDAEVLNLNPEEFVKRFSDKAEDVKSKAYVLIRESKFTT